MTCFECVYYSMWDGVCMCPTSPHLWKECWDVLKDGYREACENFEEDIDERNLREAEG